MERGCVLLPSVSVVSIYLTVAQGKRYELSPIFGDGLKDQSAAWALGASGLARKSATYLRLDGLRE
jgi:hypothetical protein